MNLINEIKLENLDSADDFFTDLRECRYILVLGAGFSYGVPNKAGGTIPTGEEFALLTKKRFNDLSSQDYKSAAQAWRTQIRNDPGLIEEFKNHFLVDTSKFDYDLYSAIFIPKWYNIYTLNFDDVLETVQANSLYKKYKVYSYPNATTGDNESNILHLHGLITDVKDLDDLVFTPESYITLESRLHSLYDDLHGDVGTHNKKILIVGSQFKEDIILRMFFRELPEDKSVKIYHFDIENYNKNSDNFTKRDASFVELKNKEGQIGVKLFLQFIEKHKNKIENISIEGAELINTTFLQKIENGTRFSKSDFFTAKMEESCQWYGILNNFDVVRNEYKKIKTIVSACFDNPQFYKVVAVVHGFGGCGKSTLLRRLAVEFCEEAFLTIWLKNGELENFTDEGLKQIQQDPAHNYLLIIEDWYRFTDTNESTKIAKELLTKTQSIFNIRIVIGDRNIIDKEYLENLPENKHLIGLHATENKKIIDEIIDHHREWRPATNKVITNESDYNTPLFLLLFIIARVSSEQFGESEIDFAEPGLAFRSIIRSDLKQISAEYPGLAKTLHMWACIYKNNKILIDYETFLLIADFYNDKQNVSGYFSNWNSNSAILRRLKNYITITKIDSLKKRKLPQANFVQFNHDKLAEEGLAQIVLKGWQLFLDTSENKYDDILLKQLLDIIVDKGSNYVTSGFLSKMFQHQNQLFETSEEKLSYINKLFGKNNFYHHYLFYLTEKDMALSASAIKVYIETLRKNNVFNQQLWSYYLLKATYQEKVEAHKTILNAEIFNSNKAEALIIAFNHPGNIEEKQVAANRILGYENITSLPAEVVRAAFNQPGNSQKKQEVAKRILDDENITSIHYDFFNIAMRQPGNKDAKQRTAKHILVDKNITLLPSPLVFIAFNQPGNEEEKQLAAKTILSDPNLLLLHYDFFIAAVKQRGNEKEKQKAAKYILESENITSLNSPFVSTALNIPGNYEEKQIAIKRILNSENLTSIHHETVVAAFKQPGKLEEKQTAAKKILNTEKITSLQSDIVIEAFSQPGNFEEKERLSKIILNDDNIRDIKQYIVVAAFYQSKCEEDKRNAASKILKDDNINSIPGRIVDAAFRHSTNNELKQNAAKRILNAENIILSYYETVEAAFAQPGNDREKQNAAKEILNAENITSIPSEFVVVAFAHPGNEEDKQKATKRILKAENILSIQSEIVAEAFAQPGYEDEKQKVTKKILTDENITSIPGLTIALAIAYSENKEERQMACKKILDAENISTFLYEFVVAAFAEPGNNDEKQQAAKRILTNENILSTQGKIILAAFKLGGNKDEKQKAAKRILDAENITLLDYEAVVGAFNQAGNNDEKQKAAKKILDTENIQSIHEKIVAAAFNQPYNTVEKQEIAKNILKSENINEIKQYIVLAAFNQPGNNEEKQKVAKKILNHENIGLLQEQIVVAAFNHPGNEEEKQNAAKRILDDNNIKKLMQYIVVAAFNQDGNDARKQEIAKLLLEDYRNLLKSKILIAAFDCPGNEKTKQIVATHILDLENLSLQSWGIILNTFKYSSNRKKLTEKAEYFLKEFRKENWYIVIQSLTHYSRIEKLPSFVIDVVNQIINDFFQHVIIEKKDSEKLYFKKYLSLLRIPFHGIHQWKEKTIHIIDYWRKYSRIFITNVLCSYSRYPLTINWTCRAILEDWKNEICEKVYKLNEDPSRGDHILISMGHPSPDLRKLIRKTAEEMLDAAKNEEIEIPPYIIQIARKITKENIFPEWSNN